MIGQTISHYRLVSRKASHFIATGLPCSLTLTKSCPSLRESGRAGMSVGQKFLSLCKKFR
jgi:hypothetical protein